MATACWNVIVELAPWLLLGAALAGLLHVTIPRELLRRQFRGVAGVWKAVGIGVPLPLCSCGVIPVAVGLKQHGAGDGAVVAFLISTPQTGVDSILVTAALLGWPLALFKVAAALVMGITGGLITEAVTSPGSAGLPIIEPPGPPQPRGMVAALVHAIDVIRSIWRWLVIGVLASAALTVYLPQGALMPWTDQGRLLAMLATLVVAAPLYVCATASVPMAAALVAGGMPTGAALVFLMAGPATNTTTIGAVYRTLGGRVLTIYLSTILVGSIGLGWLFESLIPFQRSESAAHTHDAPGWGSKGAAMALLALLTWFACAEGVRWFQRRTSTDAACASGS